MGFYVFRWAFCHPERSEGTIKRAGTTGTTTTKQAAFRGQMLEFLFVAAPRQNKFICYALGLIATLDYAQHDRVKPLPAFAGILLYTRAFSWVLC